MWDPPGPGLEPMSPALAGGFLTTAPPGKPLARVLSSFALLFFLGYFDSNFLKIGFLIYNLLTIKFTCFKRAL